MAEEDEVLKVSGKIIIYISSVESHSKVKNAVVRNPLCALCIELPVITIIILAS